MTKPHGASLARERAAVARWTGKSSKAARGFHHTYCGQCRKGVGLGEEKTFDPQCAGCAEKVKQGLRTGDEDPPQGYGSRVKKTPDRIFNPWISRKSREAIAKKKLQWPSAKDRA